MKTPEGYPVNIRVKIVEDDLPNSSVIGQTGTLIGWKAYDQKIRPMIGVEETIEKYRPIIKLDSGRTVSFKGIWWDRI